MILIEWWIIEMSLSLLKIELEVTWISIAVIVITPQDPRIHRVCSSLEAAKIPHVLAFAKRPSLLAKALEVDRLESRPEWLLSRFYFIA